MKSQLLICLALTTLISASITASHASDRMMGSQPFRRHITVRHKVPPVPPLILSGHVLLPNGTPASGGNIYISWMTNENTYDFSTVPLDSTGHFKKTEKLANVQRGQFVGVTAIVPEQGIAYSSSSLGSKKLMNLRMKIQPGVTLTGRIIRSNGAPAANTELHVETIFPHTNGQNPMMAFQFNGININGGGNTLMMSPYDYIPRLFQNNAKSPLFRARADANGNFTLTGLPRNMSALIRTSGPLVLTPSSMAPLALSSESHQNAGTLVATQTGTARIRVSDISSAKWVGPINVSLVPAKSVHTGMILYHGDVPFNTSNIFSSGTDGIVEAKKLLPGAYVFNISGRVQHINISEGRITTANIRLRQGPLTGRLLDSSGKPVSGVQIMMNTDSSQDPTTGLKFDGMVVKSNFDGFEGRGGFVRGNSGWERVPLTTTAPDGTFSLGQFPWGSQNVIIRATKGNDRAEFIGQVSSIGTSVVLHMKQDALVSVTGRLIDPHRLPVTRLTCQALHWQPSLRPFWFATAHVVMADAKGRFRIDGLERGESFSIISGGNEEQVQHSKRAFGFQKDKVQLASLSSASKIKDFESPRFETRKEGGSQDIGDVMVHPNNSQQEVLQSYGSDNREIASAGVIEAPSKQSVEQAKSAALKYSEALKSGDLKTVHALTSQLSSGYSAKMSEFVMNSSFAVPTCEMGGKQQNAVRFLPRALIKLFTSTNNTSSFISLNTSQSSQRNGTLIETTIAPPDVPFNVTSGAAIQTASMKNGTENSSVDSQPDAGRNWVMLSMKRNKVSVVTSLLHREAGEWKVLAAGLNGDRLDFVAGMFGIAIPLIADYEKKAPVLPIDKFATARETGMNYLRHWASNQPKEMLKATSAISFSNAKNVSLYTKNLEHRVDEGLCPLHSMYDVDLRPISNLSLWDEKCLAQTAQARGLTVQNSSGEFGNRFIASMSPAGFIKQNNLALLEYNTSSGRFLMELVYQKGSWKVVEPALPL